MTAGIAAALLPDLDLMIPSVLDRLGIEHRLNSGVHHSWVTHTPAFWGLIAAGARGLARRRSAPAWAPEAADMLALGAAVHLLQDALANTVALLWPLRRREYGLGLDGLGGVTDHAEYARCYPSSPAGKVEAGLVLVALLYGGRYLAHRRHDQLVAALSPRTDQRQRSLTLPFAVHRRTPRAGPRFAAPSEFCGRPMSSRFTAGL